MSESTRSIIVQKFGGSVLGSDASRRSAAEHVARRRFANEDVVAVVSAMGRGADPYATDALRALVSPPQTAGDHAALDLLMSCGEVISSVVFAQALRDVGLDAKPIPPTRLGLVTTPHFGNARILSIDTSYLAHLLAQGVTPVVPGFIGLTQDGEPTTLGRGGSDITAASIAVAMRASSLELFKDVGAIHNADPRLEPTACALEEVSYEELTRIAASGSRPVIHADAIAIAREARLMMVVRGLDARASTLIR